MRNILVFDDDAEMLERLATELEVSVYMVLSDILAEVDEEEFKENY